MKEPTALPPLLREALSAANLGLWVWDLRTHQIEGSPEYLQLIGLPGQEAPLDIFKLRDLVHPEDRDAAARGIQRYIERPESEFRQEFRLKAGAGYRWFVSRGSLQRDAKGQPLRMLGSLTDVSERKQAEALLQVSQARLRESERRFRSMLENAALLSLVLDREGRVTYCNEHFLKVTGRERAEVEGQDWFRLFAPPEHADEYRRLFLALLANRPHAWHHEGELLTRSGERRHVRWNNSVLRSPAGEVIGASTIGEDITERKQQQEHLARLSRMRDMMSAINALIVRARRRLDLYEESCRIAVERGGFSAAWIGMAHGDELATVAVHGSGAGIIRGVRFSRVPGGPNSAGPTVRAWREGKTQVCNDTDADPLMSVNRELFRAAGIRSFVSSPLWVAGEVRGCINLFSPSPNYFDEGQIALVEEMAGDIAYALEFILRDEKLDRLALYDPLTNLPNRVLLLERLHRFVEIARENGQRLSVSKLDVSHFDGVNATLGRAGGDALLQQIAERVKEIAHGPSYAARIVGDRFAIVVPDVDATGEPNWARLAEPYRIGETEIRPMFKIGTAVFPDHANDAETLMRNTEAALKHAKEHGLLRAHYTRELGEAIERRRLLESELRGAVERGEFVLHYQPKVDLRHGNVTGAEALLRWAHPERGLILPSQFVPLLEETSLIVEVGRWAIARAIDDRAQLLAAGLQAPRLAVNLSAVQLREEGVAGINAELARVPGAAEGLELEVTESAVMYDIDANIRTLRAFCEKGVGLALDDFGTGYSSLAYLSRLPLNAVKIDRSFTQALPTDARTMAIVSSVMSLARALQLTVIAEGVETDEQLRLLRLLMCDEVQGFIFCEPLPLSGLAELLRSGRKLPVTGS